jgi:phage terminase small subunit
MQAQGNRRVLSANEALELLTMVARGEMIETVITPSGKKETKHADINQRIKAIDSLMKRFHVVASLEKIEAETELAKMKTELEKAKMQAISSNREANELSNLADAIRQAAEQL